MRRSQPVCGGACLAAFAACTEPGPTPDASAPDASTDIELVVTVVLRDDVTAMLDGVDIPSYSTVTRTLPDRMALFDAEIVLAVQRGADTGQAAIISFCTRSSLPGLAGQGGKLVRERLQVVLAWPADATAPLVRHAQGTCELDDGTAIVWAP